MSTEYRRVLQNRYSSTKVPSLLSGRTEMAIRSEISASKWLAGSVPHQGVEMAHEYTGPLTTGKM